MHLLSKTVTSISLYSVIVEMFRKIMNMNFNMKLAARRQVNS